jgi:hypothetical protein
LHKLFSTIVKTAYHETSRNVKIKIWLYKTSLNFEKKGVLETLLSYLYSRGSAQAVKKSADEINKLADALMEQSKDVDFVNARKQTIESFGKQVKTVGPEILEK